MNKSDQARLAEALAKAFGPAIEQDMRLMAQQEAAKDRLKPEAEMMAKVAGEEAVKGVKGKDASLQYLIVLGMPFGDGHETIGVASAVECAMSKSMADVLMSELIPDMSRQFGFSWRYRLLAAFRLLIGTPRTPRQKWTSRSNSAALRA